jgi:hypothetical protein
MLLAEALDDLEGKNNTDCQSSNYSHYMAALATMGWYFVVQAGHVIGT